MEEHIIDQNLSVENQVQRKLEGSGGILATGIIAIPFSLGFIGLILAIVTLANASRAINTYKSNPEAYTLASYKNVTAGKTCAIVSLSLLGLSLIIVVAVLGLGG